MKVRDQAVSVPQKTAKKKRAHIKLPWKERAKTRKYFSEEPWMIRRLARVLKSSGPEEAARWAKAKKVAVLLDEISRSGIGSSGSRHTKIAVLARKALTIIKRTG